MTSRPEFFIFSTWNDDFTLTYAWTGVFWARFWALGVLNIKPKGLGWYYIRTYTHTMHTCRTNSVSLSPTILSNSLTLPHCTTYGHSHHTRSRHGSTPKITYLCTLGLGKYYTSISLARDVVELRKPQHFMEILFMNFFFFEVFNWFRDHMDVLGVLAKLGDPRWDILDVGITGSQLDRVWRKFLVEFLVVFQGIWRYKRILLLIWSILV